MLWKLTRPSIGVVGLAVAVAALCASCGGGGSATGDDGIGSGTGTGTGSSAPTGSLWHNNYPLDYRDGTQIASLDGAAPIYVTSDEYATPWPDGSQYALTTYENYENRTAVTVYDTDTGAELYAYYFAGYVRYLRPSPTHKGMFLATHSDDFLTPTDRIIADMDAGKIVQRIRSDGALNWLPDGRYFEVSAGTGRITASTVNGTPTQLGQITIPDGRILGSVSASRQGTKIAMELLIKGDAGFLESDIWVSSIDGSALSQLTDTGMSSYALWSPDGNYLAFDVDTGLWGGSGNAYGTCGIWYAPVTSSMVKALPSSGDAFRLMVRDEYMNEDSLGCDLLGWTP